MSVGGHQAPVQGPARLAILADQRDRLRVLTAELASLPPVAFERTAAEMRQRLALTGELRRVFCRHETVKLIWIWPHLRRHDPGAGALIDESIARKKQVEEHMVKLDWAGERDEDINDETAAMIDQVQAVVRIEEGLVAQLELLLGPSEVEALQRRIRRALRMAPTRPHPDLPAGPLVSRFLAPLVGVVDIVRDLATPKVVPT